MLQVQDIRKTFGDLVALKGVSFDVKRGSCFGLLGPNGAGKSTAISIVVGTLKPDKGQVEIDGRTIESATDPRRRKIGYVPQEIALYEELNSLENMRLFGTLYGLGGPELEQRMNACLDIVGLADRAKDPVKDFSGGMKRRLNIAVALIHEPELLILDEPTVGVDPQSRNAIFDCLKALQAKGLTLIYTTHYMEEVEKLCDTIAIMDHGEVIAKGTLDELYRMLPVKNKVLVRFADELVAQQALSVLNPIPLAAEPLIQGAGIELQPKELSKGIAEIATRLQNAGIEFVNLSSQHTTLEELFLHCTGRSLRD